MRLTARQQATGELGIAHAMRQAGVPVLRAAGATCSRCGGRRERSADPPNGYRLALERQRSGASGLKERPVSQEKETLRSGYSEALRRRQEEARR